MVVSHLPPQRLAIGVVWRGVESTSLQKRSLTPSSPGKTDLIEVLLQTFPCSTFVCPRCGAPKDASRLQLSGNRKFHTVLCTVCRHSTTSKKWTCECSKPWYSCDVHSFAGFRVPQVETHHRQTVTTRNAMNSQLAMPSDIDFVKAASNSRDPQLKGIKRPLAVSATSRPQPDNATKRYRTKPRNQSSSCTRGTKRRAQDDLDAIHEFTRMQLAREHPA